jgi:hypothetical protein
LQAHCLDDRVHHREAVEMAGVEDEVWHGDQLIVDEGQPNWVVLQGNCHHRVDERDAQTERADVRDEAN